MNAVQHFLSWAGGTPSRLHCTCRPKCPSRNAPPQGGSPADDPFRREQSDPGCASRSHSGHTGDSSRVPASAEATAASLSGAITTVMGASRPLA